MRETRTSRCWLARLAAPSEAEDTDTKLTLTGAALGTPMYCAPEQLTGDPIDHRADVYALGATLFQSLTGSSPFDDDSVTKVIAFGWRGCSVFFEARASPSHRRVKPEGRPQHEAAVGAP